MGCAIWLCWQMLHAFWFTLEQSGAAEACWAHNPEVDGSKPSSANFTLSGPVYGRKISTVRQMCNIQSFHPFCSSLIPFKWANCWWQHIMQLCMQPLQSLCLSLCEEISILQSLFPERQPLIRASVQRVFTSLVAYAFLSRCEFFGSSFGETCPHRCSTSGSVAEWSKALDLGSSLSGGVGSNPTTAIW